jgi:hypothetical protein
MLPFLLHMVTRKIYCGYCFTDEKTEEKLKILSLFQLNVTELGEISTPSILTL